MSAFAATAFFSPPNSPPPPLPSAPPPLFFVSLPVFMSTPSRSVSLSASTSSSIPMLPSPSVSAARTSRDRDEVERRKVKKRRRRNGMINIVVATHHSFRLFGRHRLPEAAKPLAQLLGIERASTVDVELGEHSRAARADALHCSVVLGFGATSICILWARVNRGAPPPLILGRVEQNPRESDAWRRLEREGRSEEVRRARVARRERRERVADAVRGRRGARPLSAVEATRCASQRARQARRGAIVGQRPYLRGGHADGAAHQARQDGRRQSRVVLTVVVVVYAIDVDRNCRPERPVQRGHRICFKRRTAQYAGQGRWSFWFGMFYNQFHTKLSSSKRSGTSF